MDRNICRSDGCSHYSFVALRKESVDRNNAMQIVIIIMYAVALRKESVDRNLQNCCPYLSSLTSLSARRAWIEMPWGAGGAAPRVVALRKESVDRNYIIKITDNRPAASLSARRAWIEIMEDLLPSTTRRVALRKESVDRNNRPHSQKHINSRRSPQGERG